MDWLIQLPAWTPWILLLFVLLWSSGTAFGGMVFFLLVRPPGWIREFVDSHRTIAETMKQMPRRDEMQFEQVLTAQQIILDRLDQIEEKLDGRR